MISVTNAKEIIEQHCQPGQPLQMNLAEACGFTLAADVRALTNVPPFRQSSMDGYAFSFADYSSSGPLKIQDEIAAGDGRIHELKPGTAVRIFTGAPVPGAADTVVMQEKSEVINDQLHINDLNLVQGANVRNKAADIATGELAMTTGSILSPGAIGFLAGVGVSSISVYPLPVVGIIVTGNELQKPGLPLKAGQVYESNSFALQAALISLGIKTINVYHAADDIRLLSKTLKKALEENGLVLLTGGVSVGDYDYVLQAAENCGVEKLFHKVKQKPGKPLFFGKAGGKLIFGLPGNPSSVFTCFYQYVAPAITRMTGALRNQIVLKVPSGTAFKKPGGLTHFLKGFFDGETVAILPGQESFRMRSFANANCLVEIEEAISNIDAGDIVPVHLLPGTGLY